MPLATLSAYFMEGLAPNSRGRDVSGRGCCPIPASLREVYAEGRELLALRLSKGTNDAMTYSAYRHTPTKTAPPPT